MNLSKYYAQALYQLLAKKPTEGATYLRNLHALLMRRGHTKLLPRIFSEYRKLEFAEARTKERAVESPEQARTRTLLELYRKLVDTSTYHV